MSVRLIVFDEDAREVLKDVRLHDGDEYVVRGAGEIKTGLAAEKEARRLAEREAEDLREELRRQRATANEQVVTHLEGVEWTEEKEKELSRLRAEAAQPKKKGGK